VIQKRSDLSQKYNPNLLGTDNVLIISGRMTCIIFDADFDSYLIDHALASKSYVEKYG